VIPAVPANPAVNPAVVRAAMPATLKRRLLSLIYEALILAAILLAGALPLVMITRGWDHTIARAALQAWLLLLCGVFYAWQWSGNGQTLPMKTWKLRVVRSDGAALSRTRAAARYAAALLSIATLGLGYLWAVLDRDKQFLHDRLAGTRLINDAPAATASP
jgi:uncharacterized RDD family membrane protein YckC